jgi:bifunctional DNA-binding transcriptional regulator/antitoxin component of YhaV-PrlF toxin-antitoxin module
MVLPSEVREILRIAGKAFLEYSREADKTMIVFDNLHTALTAWFSQKFNQDDR